MSHRETEEGKGARLGKLMPSQLTMFQHPDIRSHSHTSLTPELS